jgi:GNAT superfamily N-acetyltransferase
MHPGVREARESDLDRIQQLIIDLALYERAAHEVKTTVEQLRVALFGLQPAAYALVAEDDSQVVGFALYFRNFSTWEGVHGIYLEDLYVMPEYRGSGLGKALLMSLADLAVERGYARLEWAVLDWNQPAIDLLPQPGSGRDGRVDRLPALWRRACGCRHRNLRELGYSAKRLSDTAPPVASTNPPMARGMRPGSMASP